MIRIPHRSSECFSFEDSTVNQKLIAAAFTLAALASGSAFSQSTQNPQFYVGGNVGVSHANRGCGAVDVTGANADCDKNDTALKIYGGYQLPGTPFAAELSYFDLGHFNASNSFGSAKAKDSYWGLGAAYRPDFGAGWGGVARLGAAYGIGKEDYSLAGGASGSDTKHDWHPYYGLGVNYALTRNVKLEADWDNTRMTTQVPGFASATGVVNTYSLGATYGF